MKPAQQKTEPRDEEKPSPGDIIKPPIDLVLSQEYFSYMTQEVCSFPQFSFFWVSITCNRK